MARPLVPDALWAEIEPLLPTPRPRPKGGRPPVPDRAALAGILFVLKSGVPWETLPRVMGRGSGMTCWRRLRDRQEAGVRAALHRVPLDRLGRANAIDWSRCALDSASVPAKRGASGPARTRRTGAGRAASATSWSMPTAPRPPSPRRRRAPTTAGRWSRCSTPCRRSAGRPRRRPGKLHADKGCDYRRCRRACRQRGVVPRIARRGVDGPERLGRHRRVVERTLARLARFRRLAVRYERRADLFEALHHLAASLICLRFAERWFC